MNELTDTTIEKLQQIIQRLEAEYQAGKKERSETADLLGRETDGVDPAGEQATNLSLTAQIAQIDAENHQRRDRIMSLQDAIQQLSGMRSGPRLAGEQRTTWREALRGTNGQH